MTNPNIFIPEVSPREARRNTADLIAADTDRSARREALANLGNTTETRRHADQPKYLGPLIGVTAMGLLLLANEVGTNKVENFEQEQTNQESANNGAELLEQTGDTLQIEVDGAEVTFSNE